jgi:hypothetical protein
MLRFEEQKNTFGNSSDFFRFFSKINVNKLILMDSFPSAYRIVLLAEREFMFAKKKDFVLKNNLFLALNFERVPFSQS